MNLTKKLLPVLCLLVIAATSGATAASEAPQALLDKLKSTNWQERCKTVSQLAQFESLNTAKVLADILKKDEHVRVAIEASKVLLRYKSDDVFEYLKSQLKRSGGDKLRHYMLLWAVGAMRNPKADELLYEYADKRIMEYKIILCEILAMKRQPSDKAYEKLTEFIDEKNHFPLKLSAAQALACLPDKRSLPLLVGALKNEGRVAEYAARGLLLLTGKNKGISHREWDIWLQTEGKDFQIDVNAAKAKQFNQVRLAKKETEGSFYGIHIYGKNILFIIDISGSMNAGKPKSRIDNLRENLTKTIQSLRSDFSFNIMTFNNKIDTWKSSKLYKATDKNKKSACKFVNDIKIDPAGMTHTDEAIEQGFKKFIKHCEVETLFLLTDGMPAKVDMKAKKRIDVDAGKIFWDTAAENRFMKVRIHTIGSFVGGVPQNVLTSLRQFLGGMAKMADGEFVEVK